MKIHKITDKDSTFDIVEFTQKNKLVSLIMGIINIFGSIAWIDLYITKYHEWWAIALSMICLIGGILKIKDIVK